jgi:spermidine synthase
MVVYDGELSQGIVFACTGNVLETHPVRAIRRPKDLVPAAASLLLAGFALIASALKDQRI